MNLNAQQTQKAIFQVNTQDFVKKYAACQKYLCIFVFAVGWVVCAGSVLAQIPPQGSPEGCSCTVSYVQFLTPLQNHTQLTVFQRSTTAANATAKSLWHLGINPLNQALADGLQDQTNKTKTCHFAISLKVRVTVRVPDGSVAMLEEGQQSQREYQLTIATA